VINWTLSFRKALGPIPQTAGFVRRITPSGHRRLLLGAMLAFLFPGNGGLMAEGSELWSENFQGYSLGPALDFGKGLEIREEGDLKFLSKLDSNTEFIFSQNIATASPEAWVDYMVTIRYREPEKSTATVVVKARGERGEMPYMQYYVGVRSTGFSIRCHGIPPDQKQDDPRQAAEIKFEDIGVSPFAVGEWITVRVTVGNEVVRVSVDSPDQQVREAEFKVYPGSGGVSFLTRSPVDIASIRIESVPETVIAKP